MNLTKSSIKIIIARLGGFVISTLGTIYFARDLGSANFGTFVLFQALAQMLAVPADFGIHGAIIKRMSEQENSSEILSSAIFLLCVSLSIVCSFIFLFRDFINNYIGAQLALLLIIFLIFNEGAKLTRNVLKGELRVGETAFLNFAQQLVYTGLGAIMVSMGIGFFGLVYSIITALAAVIVIGLYKWETTLGRPSINAIRSLFSFSKFSVISHIDSYLYNWLDVAVIGFLLSQSAVGKYEIAWRVSAMVMLFSSAVERTILPQISAWDSQGTEKQIEELLPNALLASLLFVIPSFFGVAVLSEEILYFIFSPEYVTAAPILIILIGGRLLESIDIIFKNILSGMDHPDLRAIAVLISISLNIFLNLLLVQSIGSIGAAIATVSSFAVSTAVIAYYVTHIISITIPYQEILFCVFSSIVMATILWEIKIKIEIESSFDVLILILIGSIIYFSLLLFSPSIRRKFRYILRTVVE